MRKLLRPFVSPPIRAGLVVLLLLAGPLLAVTYSQGLYDREFFSSVLVEAQGLILDLIAIGILVYWLTGKGEEYEQIKRYKDEIDDFRGWKSDEAAYRIAGTVRRLNKLGVTQINLRRCFLGGASLEGVNLRRADLYNVDLRRLISMIHALPKPISEEQI